MNDLPDIDMRELLLMLRNKGFSTESIERELGLSLNRLGRITTRSGQPRISYEVVMLVWNYALRLVELESITVLDLQKCIKSGK